MSDALNAQVVLDAVSRLAQLRFFPGDPQDRAGIAQLISEICSTDEQVQWLARRMTQLFNDWPGPLELRNVFCSRFHSADGIDICRLGAFPDGIPREHPTPAMLNTPEVKLLPGVVSADPELDAQVCQLALTHPLPHVPPDVAAREAPDWLREVYGLPPKLEDLTDATT